MVNARPLVAFRVDAGLHIGGGHLMRCLSLAGALRALGAQSLFVCRAHPGHPQDLVAAQGHESVLLPPGAPTTTDWLGVPWAHDADQTLAACGTRRPDWLVVDHYALDARWERLAGRAAGRVLAIDDLADRPHDVDLLLDQNLQRAPGRYDSRVPARTRQLLGPRFALLRPEFAERRARRRRPAGGPMERVLAFAGSVDATGLLPKVLGAWQQMAGTGVQELHLVVGRGSPGLDELARRCASVPGATLHVQTPDMAALLAEADLVITAGGGVNWERCCLSVPAIVVQTADNQRENVVLLARARTAVSLGRADALSEDRLADLLRRLAARPGLRRRMARRCGRLVDGAGARRAALAMFSDRLRLRTATPGDAEPCWHWRNHPDTRRYFTDPREVPLDRHRAWWSATLADRTRWLAVAEVLGVPVGVVRLDRDPDDSATVSIYLDPALTGVGLGVPVLRAAERDAGPVWPGLARLQAVIDPRNTASQSVFGAAGYVPAGERWERRIGDG